MSQKFTGITHMTVRCLIEVEPIEGGARVRLAQEPNVKGDSTIFFGNNEEAQKYSEEMLRKVNEILQYTILKRAAEGVRLPEDVKTTNTVESVTKPEMN